MSFPKKNLILLSGPTLLLLLILLKSNHLVYDEPYYFENVKALALKGFSVDFFKNLAGPAGPLHAVFYWLISKFSNIENIAFIRCVSLTLGLLSIGVVSLVKTKSPVHADALLILACPVFYVCSGLALTEAPAIFFFSLGILFFSRISGHWVNALISAILLSLAITGRQPLLMFLPGILLAYLYIKIKTNRNVIGEFGLIKILIVVIFSLIVPVYLFYLWGGIVPHIGGDDATKKSFDITNGLLGLGYLTLFIFFLYPNFIFQLLKGKARFLLLITIISLLLNILIFKIEFYFVNSVALKIIPANYYEMYGLLAFGVLLALSFISLILGYTMFAFCKNDFIKLSLLLGTFLIVLTCFKVTHQFSSRYVYQCVLLLIPVLHGYSKSDYKSISINLIGILLGLLSFNSYLT